MINQDNTPQKSLRKEDNISFFEKHFLIIAGIMFLFLIVIFFTIAYAIVPQSSFSMIANL
jgi:hypothetical protein